MSLLSLLTKAPAGEMAPQDLQRLIPGTVIQNSKGEYGVIVDRDKDGQPLESKMVLRLTRKQAKRLMRYIDRGCQ